MRSFIHDSPGNCDYATLATYASRLNLYLLLWVDHHDDAYAWARNRKCSVHPETGSLQVFEVQETVREAEQSPAPEAVPPLFEGVKEKYLLRIPFIRKMKSIRMTNICIFT